MILSCRIASPDNLALIPEQQVLIIGEDTSNHQVRCDLPITYSPITTQQVMPCWGCIPMTGS